MAATKTTPQCVSEDSEKGLMTGDTNKPTTSTQLRNNMEEEEKEGVGGEDRISKLPEALVHHILSLLPTKCAVSTTVLSKGWKNLWVTVPVLDFREWTSPNAQVTRSSSNNFMDFVDRVLVLRDMSCIKRFCITCNGNVFDNQRIKAWITRAIECRVEELIVRSRSFSGHSDVIPVDLYTCESLISLNIELYSDTLYLPQTISFPRLKILRLTQISFCNEQFTQQLFSGCLLLEELSLRDCTWKDLNFISSTLKVLTLNNCLRGCSSCYTTKNDTPNLMCITINDSLRVRMSLVVDSFPSLVDADVRSMNSWSYEEADIISKFVMKLSNVKLLKLSGTCFEYLELANVLSTSFPSFINLSTLEVRYIKGHQVRPLFTFLQFSPNLESVIFAGVSLYIDVALTLDVVPHCLLMHLKSIKFQEFEGHLKELDLLQIFLQNAAVLQTVILEIPSDCLVDSEKKKHTAKDVEDFNEKIMEQLLKYKWASTDCAINFSVIEL